MTAVLAIVPAYKNQLTGTTLLTTHALATGLRSKGIDWGITSMSNPDIEWVRNWFITLFYDRLKQYSHALFIDDDMGFMPDLVLDMLSFGEPVVGGLYPKKTIDRQWAVSGLPTPEIRGPFVECEGIGCGCFLIRRDAITTMLEKMPELIDTRPHTIDSELFREAGVTRMIRAFDKINDPSRGTVSEDISFGRRWRECGGKVWAATHHKMVHVGPHEFADTYSVWAEQKKAEQIKRGADRMLTAEILKTNPVLRAKQAKHGLVVYNPNDTFIGRSIEAYGEWCEFELDLMRQFIKDGDTVIDVGANIGTHTLAFSRSVGKHGKVFAFEPQPRIEAILEANIKLNELGNVFWDRKAVGSECANLMICGLPPDTEEYNFGGQPINDRRIGEGCTVDIVTIDSFAADGAAYGVSPSLIKIDVEGMEANVIEGAVATIERCKPALYVENNGETSIALAEMLDRIGYVAYWHLGPYFNPDNVFKNGVNIWQASHPNLMPSANMICVPAADGPLRFPQVEQMQPYRGGSDNWRDAIKRMAAAEQRQQAAE